MSSLASTLPRTALRIVVVALLVGLISVGVYAAEEVYRAKASDGPSPRPVSGKPLTSLDPAPPAETPTRIQTVGHVALPPLEVDLAPAVLLEPGDKGPGVRRLQARLRQIYWFNTDVTGEYGQVTEDAVSGFQAKREIPVTGKVDQLTMDRLTEMTSAPSQAALDNRIGHNEPGALDPRCRTGRVLCIDKTSRTLRWVVEGEVSTTVDVRFGAVATPTREGVFSVYVKSRDHVSSLYDSAMPFAMFFDGGQAVHYSSDFAATGYNGASHGCVNVRDRGAVEALFDQVVLGDKVVVYRS